MASSELPKTKVADSQLSGDSHFNAATASEPFDALMEEQLSYESFNDLLRKACQEFAACAEDENLHLDNLIEAMQVLQTFVLSPSANLSLEEVKIVLDLVLNACVKVENTTILRQGCIFLNRWLEDNEICITMNKESSLKQQITELGKQLYTVADYESQALLLETMIRICGTVYRDCWSKRWFSSDEVVSHFKSINPQNFEVECRCFLNFLNKGQKGKKVFSFIARAVTLGPVELKKPCGTEFWIDFNYGTRSISFYCVDLFADNSSPSESKLATWETIAISLELVSSCSLIMNSSANSQELVINLHISYFDLLSCGTSSFTNYDGHQIRILFWNLYDISTHLQNIFGNLYEGQKWASIDKKESHEEDYNVSEEITSSVIEKTPEASDDALKLNYQKVPSLDRAEDKVSDGAVPQCSLAYQEGCTSKIGRKVSISRTYFQSHASEEFFSVNTGESSTDSRNGSTSKASHDEQDDVSDSIQVDETQGFTQPTAQIDHDDSSHHCSEMELTPIVEPKDHPTIIVETNTEVINDNQNKGKDTVKIFESSNDSTVNASCVVSQERVKQSRSRIINDKTEVTPLKRNRRKFLKNDSNRYKQPEVKLLSGDESLRHQNEEETNTPAKKTNCNQVSLSEEINSTICFIEKTDENPTKDTGSEKQFDTLKSSKKEITEGCEDTSMLKDVNEPEKKLTKRFHLFKAETAPMLTISPEIALTNVHSQPTKDSSVMKQNIQLSQTSPLKKVKTPRKQKSKISSSIAQKTDSGIQVSFQVDSDPGSMKNKSELTHPTPNQTRDTVDKKSASAIDSGFATMEKTRFITVPENSSQKSISKKRSTSDELTVSSERTTKSGRKAAKKSMERTHKLLTEKSSTVSYNSVDSEWRPHTSSISLIKAESKTRHKSHFTDIESGSSEVSWYNKKKKSCSLFETPVKNYSRPKSNEKKKKETSKVKKAASKPSSSKVQNKGAKKEVQLQEGLNKITSSDWSSIERFQLITNKKDVSDFMSTPKKASLSKSLHMPSGSHQPPGYEKRGDAFLKLNSSLVTSGQKTRNEKIPTAFCSSSSAPPSPITVDHSSFDIVNDQERSAIDNFVDVGKSAASLSLEKKKALHPIGKMQGDVDQSLDNGIPANEKFNSGSIQDTQQKSKKGHSGMFKACIPSSDILGGKADHLKRFLNDVSSAPCDDAGFEAESVNSIRGSPLATKDGYSLQSSPENYKKQEVYSKQRQSQKLKRDRNFKARKAKEVEQFAESVRKILSKYKDLDSSDPSVTNSSTTDDLPLVQWENIISPEFFDETRCISRKLFCTMQKFIADFFDRLVAYRRELFYSITSARYDDDQLHLSKDILDYQKCSSLIRLNLHKRLKKIKEALNVYMQVEERFDKALEHFRAKVCQQYEKKFRAASKKALFAQQAQLIKELKHQLSKLSRRFYRRGTL